MAKNPKNSISSIVFLGTPAFALPSLAMLIDGGFSVKAVITQPDRPKGRGHKLIAPPVKQYAMEKGIPVYQFDSLSKEGVSVLRDLAPDLMITAAFGQILSEEVLAIPTYGCINVHASLLPKYRGAAPIEWAILNGETETGVTTMFTVRRLDAGDILEQDRIPILPQETGGQLRERLAKLGAETLARTLAKLQDGSLTRQPQREEEATHCHMLKKELALVDFSRSAKETVNQIRGLNPMPMAYMLYQNCRIKLLQARPAHWGRKAAPGSIVAANAKEGLFLQCADDCIEIEWLHYPGGKPMPAKDFIRGHQNIFIINGE